MTLPSGLAALAVRVAGRVPDRVLAAVLPRRLGFRMPAELPYPAPHDTAVRLFLAPANFAGQGWQWARAAERGLEGVSAVSMAYSAGGGYRYPIDIEVPAADYLMSPTWQRRERAAVTERFTHVIVEAGRHLFGDVYRESVADEIRSLQQAGLQVAMLTHGSDMRSPRRHARTHRHSPFADGEWAMTPLLEKETARNRALLEEVHTPIFVSTPGMLADVPEGTWLPVVVDASRWSSPPVALEGVPLVLHAPSSPVVKGTNLVEPMLHRLVAEGVIRYERLEGVLARDMPDRLRDADIVLDQFRIGDYGVAACEAMAAGRVVVGDVDASVRTFVLSQTGRDLPVVQADPESLESVLRDILARRDHYRGIAAAGPPFVAEVHDGARSARALSSFLGAAPARPAADG
jgi:hypothetical protein